jgi:lycopene beta-cyclase
MSRFDYCIVGGGLQGGLIALAIGHFQPSATVALIEEGEKLGGNHTWSFHSLDVPAAASAWVRPLISAQWPGNRVRFPGLEREIHQPYRSISSEQFCEVVTACLNRPGQRLFKSCPAVNIAADRVELGNGVVIYGTCVIDARGSKPSTSDSGCGFQKFLGFEIETEQPWRDRLPTVMDAVVPQDDGYRFVYTLPFTANRVLIEDTYFSDSRYLDAGRARELLTHYIESRQIGPWQIVREESGVLPMPWTGFDLAPMSGGPIVTGYSGGWFHPATGYSFPMAVRLALAVSGQLPEFANNAVAALSHEMRRRHQFAKLLNFLLFRAVTPRERWQIFRRLYRELPDIAMARFYAMEFNLGDAVRILAGWPPPLDPRRLFGKVEISPCPLPLN